MNTPKNKDIRSQILSHVPCPYGCGDDRSVEDNGTTWSLVCYDCDSEAQFAKGYAEADAVFEELKED